MAGVVARKVPTHNRLCTLPWAYHRDVASLEPEQQKRALAWAEKNYPNDLTERGFKAYIKKDILKQNVDDDNGGDDGGDDKDQDEDEVDVAHRLSAISDDLERAKDAKKAFENDFKRRVSEQDAAKLSKACKSVADAWNEMADKWTEIAARSQAAAAKKKAA